MNFSPDTLIVFAIVGLSSAAAVFGLYRRFRAFRTDYKCSTGCGCADSGGKVVK
ncbi:MAG: hypothetical protein ACK42A_02000 [Pyrinomonadaceae bacterium]